MNEPGRFPHAKKTGAIGPAADFLRGGGEMGALMRAFDWGNTPLGPSESWPQNLKTAVRIMLSSRQPIWIGWGEDLIYLYNDAYKSIIGGKHPRALGQPTSVVWKEIWNDIGPMLTTAMTGIEGTYVEAQLLIMERNGYPEETYYTFSYSPIPNDDGSAGGIICANSDDTQRVIGERQLALLRALAAGTADARTSQEAQQRSAHALGANPSDLPFAMIYMVEPESGNLSLAGACGIERGHPAAPETVTADSPTAWPFGEVLRTHDLHVVSGLRALFGADLPAGAWRQPPSQAAVLPILPSGETGRAGVLVVGLNPFRFFDENYRGFLGLVAGQIAAVIANARAYEEERRRAEALAEIDRAKTAFFSNVSHEFRTPLTLLMSPIEEILAKPENDVTPDNRALLDVAHRNSLRLLRLVNSLLDFSRIEAGRVQASYEPTDLAALTAELASNFRSACEKAGLRLVVDCPPLPEPVFVDRDMWEKIVLNLVSNAFKFTFEGEIRVTLRTKSRAAVLSVADTGIGVPANEIPRLFDRFHRVEGARGRTHEGSGIGLALVQELVKLHGGTAQVESVHGRGTRLTVSIPLGAGHLPPDRIRAARTQGAMAHGATPYVEEALRWLPEERGGAISESGIERAILPEAPLAPESSGAGDERPAVLLADDNADMRDYVRRLLSARYEVRTVADGEAALAALREGRFDLLLSDVMMPRLDGFGLLRAVRADPALADLPVVLLSARAGEEASIEGLEAGADDYLVKPFSARELAARVAANLEMARLRIHRRKAEESARVAQERLVSALAASGTGTFRWDIRTNEVAADEAVSRLFGLAPREMARSLDEFIPLIYPDDRQGLIERCERCAREGADFEMEFRVVWPDDSLHWIYDRGKIFRDAEGRPAYLAGACVDITERKRAEVALRNTRAQLQAIVDDAPLGVYLIDADFRIRQVNPTARPVFGDVPDLIGRDFDDVIHILWSKEYADEVVRLFRHTLETGEAYITPERIEERRDRGVTEYYEWQISRMPLPEGRYGVVCYFRDISAQVFARQAIAASEERLRELNEMLERKVEERTLALEAEMHERRQAEAALQQAQKMEAVGQLTGGVAHDFNNVLAAVLGNLELAQSRTADPAVRRFLQSALGAAERGAKLTGHLLAFARKQTLSREPSDLNRLIVSFKDLLTRALGPSIEVRLALADDLWTVSTDTSQFEMALLNLALNARDAMPERGMLAIETMNVAGGSPELPADLAADGEYVCVRVSDTGAGMSPAVAARAFDPFFTTKEIGKGTGLGLSQVYGFAKQLGGTATLSSDIGRGTRVDIFMPRAQGDAAVAAPTHVSAAEPATTQASGARILVIDDEPDVRDFSVEALRSLGFDVMAAETPRRGLEILNNGAAVDLAVVDFAMPEMNGIEFIRRTRLSRPTLPCLLVTGYADLSKVDGMPPGGVTTLRKPFKVTELAAAVDQLLERIPREEKPDARSGPAPR